MAFTKSTNTHLNQTIQLNQNDFNDDTFLRFNVYGEHEDSKDSGSFTRQSSSKQALIPLVNRSPTSRLGLTFKQCELILTNWIREHSGPLLQNLDLIHKYYSCIYCHAIPFTLKSERLRGIRWSLNQNQKTYKIRSPLKLLNTDQTFMLHQDKLREGRRRKSINFEQLNRWHSLELEECIPSIQRCNTATFRIEIYQKFLDYSNHGEEDRTLAPLSGKHKIGIIGIVGGDGIKPNKRIFIGIMSSFNYNVHRVKYRRDKREGELYRVDATGNRKLIANEIALRKHETVEVKIDWISRKLIFRRLQPQEYGGGQKTKDIVLDLNTKDLLQMDWSSVHLSAGVCVNDVESFMWNDDNDKDFITYTLDSALIS